MDPKEAENLIALVVGLAGPDPATHGGMFRAPTPIQQRPLPRGPLSRATETRATASPTPLPRPPGIRRPPRAPGLPPKIPGLHGRGGGGLGQTTFERALTAVPSYKPVRMMPGSPGFRRTRAVPMLEAQTRGSRRMGPVWPVGSPAMKLRSAVRGFRGLGAAGASAFTVQAATALDEHLTTNTCAGCDDMKSALRQLTFTFKAACLTDEKIVNNVSLNISTSLAMTGFGPGTDKALSLVLDKQRTYEGGPCTDDDGRCLGNFSTPVLPKTAQTLEQQLVSQIAAIIAMQKSIPQAQSVVVPDIIAAFVALISALPPLPAVNISVAPPNGMKPPPPAPPEKKDMTTTFLVGGLIGVAVVGTVVALTMAYKKG